METKRVSTETPKVDTKRMKIQWLLNMLQRIEKARIIYHGEINKGVNYIHDVKFNAEDSSLPFIIYRYGKRFFQK